jgi:hypothetical protein
MQHRTVDWMKTLFGLLVLYLGSRELYLWSNNSPEAWSAIPLIKAVGPWLGVLLIGVAVALVSDLRFIFGTIDSRQRNAQFGSLLIAALCAGSLYNLLFLLLTVTDVPFLAQLAGSSDTAGARASIPIWVVISIALSAALAYLASKDFYRHSEIIQLAAGNDLLDCQVAVTFIYARSAVSDDAVLLIKNQLLTMGGELKRVLDQHSEDERRAFAQLNQAYNALQNAVQPERLSKQLEALDVRLNDNMPRLVSSIQRDFLRICNQRADEYLRRKNLKIGRNCEVEVGAPIVNKSKLFEDRRREITETRNAALTQAATDLQQQASTQLQAMLSGLKDPEEVRTSFDNTQRLATELSDSVIDPRLVEGARSVNPLREHSGSSLAEPSHSDTAISPISRDLRKTAASDGSTQSGLREVDTTSFTQQLIKSIGRDNNLHDPEIEDLIGGFFKEHRLILKGEKSTTRSAIRLLDLLKEMADGEVITEELIVRLLNRGDLQIWQLIS